MRDSSQAARTRTRGTAAPLFLASLPRGPGEKYLLNNSYVSRMARLAMEVHPELAEMEHARELQEHAHG